MTYDYDPGTVPLFNGAVILEHVGERWRFRQPVRFFYAVMPDYTLYLESIPLYIIAQGRGWKALFKDMDEYMTDLWEDYVLEDDEKLDESGIKLKKTLLDNIEFIGGELHGSKA